MSSRLLTAAVILALTLTGIGALVYSSFASVTVNDDNYIQASGITLTDNDAGSALFEVDAADGGDVYTRCIRVSYDATGGATSTVRLYGTAGAGGTGLATYLTLRVRRGTGTAADCSDFAADVTNHSGLGAGVLFNAGLGTFPIDYSGGIIDPDTSWSDGETATYELRMSLADDNAAQGLRAEQDFLWEARVS